MLKKLNNKMMYNMQNSEKEKSQQNLEVDTICKLLWVMLTLKKNPK